MIFMVSLPGTLSGSFISLTNTFSLIVNFSMAKKSVSVASAKIKYHELLFKNGYLFECTKPASSPSFKFSWVTVILIVNKSPTAISFSPSTKASTFKSMSGKFLMAASTSLSSFSLKTSISFLSSGFNLQYSSSVMVLFFFLS